MEMLNNLIPEKYLFALGWMIIHSLWQIAGIGILLLLSQKIFKNNASTFKYRLSIAALFLISIISISTFFYYSNESVSPAENIVFSSMNEKEVILLINAQNSDSLLSADTSTLTILAKRIENWLPMLVNIWFIGALLFMVRLAGSLADIRNLKSKSHYNPDPEWKSFLSAQMQKIGLKKPIAIFKTVHVEMPITYGIFKPVILIPVSLAFQLTPAQLEAIITHELAHIKRHDYLINLFQSFLEVIFFYHPVFWWINKIAREQRENACDDLAIQMGVAPKDLAYGLANVLNHAQTKAPEIAMAASKLNNPTLDRIKRIMGIKTAPNQPPTFMSLTMIITLLLSATLMVGASEENTEKTLDQFIATGLSTVDIEGNWLGNLSINNADTVPKKTIIIQGKDLEGMTEEEKAKFEEILKGSMKDLKFIFKDSLKFGMVFKDLDFPHPDFSNMPNLELKELPMLHFNFESMPKLELDGKHFKHVFPDSMFLKMIPDPQIFMRDSTGKIHTKHLEIFKMDTSKMSKKEREEMLSKLREKLATQAEERSKHLEKMQQERVVIIQEMAKKREEFQKEIQPQIKEYQLQMQKWQNENEPLIKEFEAKMKSWQEENKPQLEEFQQKMEQWQKENQVQMQEFQKQMQEWQKEHQKQMQELQKVIQENVKKGDN